MIISCPVCASENIYEVLTAEDYTVSGERFSIWECGNCSLRFTQDVPDEKHIVRYYQSANYISHSDTRKGLINRLYHRVRHQTLKQKRNWIQMYTQPNQGTLLDIGCGTGAFLSVMQQAGWQASGLEPDGGARKIAKETHQLDVKDMEQFYQLPENSFDAVTLWHVLEHVHELHAYVEQLKKLLKPTGYLFIAVPNYTSKDAQLYKDKWAAYDVPRHLYHFSPQAMARLMAIHTLKVGEMKPLIFDPFYISLLSEKYRNGNIHWMNGVMNGFRSFLNTKRNRESGSSILYIINKMPT